MTSIVYIICSWWLSSSQWQLFIFQQAYLAAGVPKQQQCSDEECAGDGDGDGCDAESDNTIRWSVDFSECGLAIKHISLKARSSSPRSRGKAPVSFNIVRDNMESYSLDGLNLNGEWQEKHYPQNYSLIH